MANKGVYIVPHDPKWAGEFADEAQDIITAIGAEHLALHHIGSTAIAGIYAKPIIDMLGCAHNIASFPRFDHILAQLGYQAMGSYGIKGRLYYRKYDDMGVKTHHLHIYAMGSDNIRRHLAFRDYLRSHPDKAKQYSQVKQQAALVQNLDMQGYIAAKSLLILTLQKEAMEYYRTIEGSEHYH